MRIRKNASRLLGSAYSVPQAPAPDAAHSFEPLKQPAMPPVLAPCSAPESVVGGVFANTATACGETCQLSCNPWDLIAQLSLSDPQEEDPVDKYFVSVPCRANWLLPASMPVTSRKKEKQTVDAGTIHTDSTSQPRRQFPKKVSKKLSVSKEKENEPRKKAKMKKEEQQLEIKQPTYMCKKNDGKGWHCPQPVSHPNSLCDYHFNQKRAYLNPQFAALEAAEAEIEVRQSAPAPSPAASKKPAKSTSSKVRKKKPRPNFGATEGFYYYTGFGPFRSKRQYRSSGMNESFPSVKQEEEDEPAKDSSSQQAPAASGPGNKSTAHDDVSSCDDIARIAGGDEELSDGDNGFGVSGHSMNGNGVHRDGKRKNVWNNKRCRKPVKARSLKSLM